TSTGCRASGAFAAGFSAAGGFSGDAGSGSAPAALGTSIAMIGVPTSTVWPASTSRAVTVPANGLGSSTTAFAVSMSTMIWLIVTVSPGLTCQETMSASVRTSPTSGSLNSFFTLLPSVSECAVDRVQDPVQVGQVVLFRFRGRVRDREPADPQHRSLEGVEAVLGHPGGDLGAEPRVDGRLVGDHAAAGAGHR